MFSPAVVPPADALRFVVDLRGQQRGVLVHAAAAAGLWLVFALLLHTGRPAQPLFVIPVALYTVLAVFWVISCFGARRRPLEIALTSAELFMPTLRRWTGMRRVPLTALRRIDRYRLNGTGYLGLGVRAQWPLTMPLAGFASADDAHRFVDALALRTRLRVQVLRADREPTLLAITLAAVLVLAYLGRAWAASELSYGLLEWGGLNRVLVLEGHWFRLVTAALVQTDPLHLAIDVGLLLLFLPDVERLMGSASAILLLAAGTVGGSLAALAAHPDAATVGASATVYALLGAATWLWFTERRRVPLALFNVPAWALGSLLTIDLVLTLVNPFMSVAGQGMGFIIGAGVTGLLQRSTPLLRTMLAWAGVAAGAAALLAVGAGMTRAFTTDAAVAIARTLVTSHHATIDDANYGAWSMATDPNAPLHELENVRTALAKRIDRAGEVPAAVRDTLATLHYRRGDFETAVAIESRVLDEAPDRLSATQLARFELAAGPASDQVPVQLERRAGTACIVAGPPDPVDVDVVVTRGAGQLIGLFRILRVRGEHCLDTPPALVGGAVTMSISRAVHTVAAARTEPLIARFWPADAALAALP